MGYKITDTGSGIRLQIKNSIIDLTIGVPTLLKDIVNKRKEKKQ